MQLLYEHLLRSNLALPNDERLPTGSEKLLSLLRVALDVSINLAAPVLSIGRRQPSASTTGMAVPETPMDENNLAHGSEDNVGRAGKIFAVKTVTVTEAMKQTTDYHLGLCVTGPDRPHGAAPQIGSGHL